MKTQDFFSVDDTQQVGLRSKFRQYFTQALLSLVLLSYKEGANWKIVAPHSCIAASATLAYSSAYSNAHWVIWEDSSVTPAAGKPECSLCFDLKCMQGHISPLFLQLCQPPSILSFLAAMLASQCQKNKTRHRPLQAGLEHAYCKSRGVLHLATRSRSVVLGMA